MIGNPCKAEIVKMRRAACENDTGCHKKNRAPLVGRPVPFREGFRLTRSAALPP